MGRKQAERPGLWASGGDSLWLPRSDLCCCLSLPALGSESKASLLGKAAGVWAGQRDVLWVVGLEKEEVAHATTRCSAKPARGNSVRAGSVACGEPVSSLVQGRNLKIRACLPPAGDDLGIPGCCWSAAEDRREMKFADCNFTALPSPPRS